MTKEEQQTTWAERVANFKFSGLSVPKWCAEHDIKPSQLRYWLKKNTQVVETPARWLSLNLSDVEPASLLIQVEHAVIEVSPGFDPQLLLSVVKTLSRK